MEMNRFPEFSKRFRDLRGSKTQAEFAEQLGISRPTVGYYENGTRVPDALTLKQIAEKSCVTTDYLLGLTDDPNRMPAAADELGLTEEAIKNLRGIKQYGLSIDQNAINQILEHATLWNFFVPEGSEWRDKGADVLHAIGMYLAQGQTENSAILVIPSDGKEAQKITFDDRLRFLPQNYDVPVAHLARKALLDSVCQALNEMKNGNE